MACNLPIFPAPSPTPDLDVAKAARETLPARLFATPLATQAPLAPDPQVVPQPTGAVEPPAPEVMPPQVVVTPGLPVSTLEGNTYRYITLPGDTIEALALRFGVTEDQVLPPGLYPAQALLPAGLMLSIPNAVGETIFYEPLLPDGEIVNGPSAADFIVQDYIQSAGGYLSTYTEETEHGSMTGAQIIQRVSNDMSINPRILLAFLEYRSQWVRGRPVDAEKNRHPIGFYANQYSGLYKETVLVARQLTIGFYGWRSGKVVYLGFTGSPQQRINPTVNAGTAALQYLFSTIYKTGEWQNELYNTRQFLLLFHEMFGDPWARAAQIGPQLPDNLAQPVLELPFQPGERWSFTGGPHAAWGIGTVWGGIDFAPVTGQARCTISTAWATASAPGLVLRSENGLVMIDLDGDGREQTGWVLMYLHVAAQDRVPAGTWLNVDDRIGHPSCEGGVSTGTHIHLARKYNGEWIGADGPAPFVLSGWQAVYGPRPYDGVLIKGESIVTARPDGSHTSSIVR